FRSAPLGADARAARRPRAGVGGADEAYFALRPAAGGRFQALRAAEAGDLSEGERQTLPASGGSAHHRRRLGQPGGNQAARFRSERLRRHRRLHPGVQRSAEVTRKDMQRTAGGLLSMDEALEVLLDGVQPVAGVEEVPTQEATGRVLAADQRSGVNVPPLDNTSMDGYAVRAADCTGSARLRVTQRIAAGDIGQPLEPGTAARIFTGAPN